MTAHHQNHTRLTFELPTVDHKKLKAMAALAGVSLKELIFGHGSNLDNSQVTAAAAYLACFAPHP